MINFTDLFSEPAWKYFSSLFTFTDASSREERARSTDQHLARAVYQTSEEELLDNLEFKVTSPVVVQLFSRTALLQATETFNTFPLIPSNQKVYIVKNIQR